MITPKFFEKKRYLFLNGYIIFTRLPNYLEN
jgi:hypothetical protein